MKRKQISTKTRFEIFKRDQFTCQYCGETPPKVLLHVDHIVAVADGGGNETDNLATSCVACNLGKGARSLRSIPQALGEKAAVVKEREAQLLGYHKIMQGKRDRLERECWNVISALAGESTSKCDERDFMSVWRFLEKLPFHTVLSAAEYARNRNIFWSATKRFKYFCAICWNKIRGDDGAVS